MGGGACGSSERSSARGIGLHADECAAAAAGPLRRPAAAKPQIQLLIVQPTPFCNIDCRYCYLPDRTSKAVVSDETLHNLFSQIFSAGWADGALSVVWHAGEPMVLPIAFYRRVFRLIDELKPPGLDLSQAFQTNGTLINDEWCRFFCRRADQYRRQYRWPKAPARPQPGDTVWPGHVRQGDRRHPRFATAQHTVPRDLGIVGRKPGGASRDVRFLRRRGHRARVL